MELTVPMIMMFSTCIVTYFMAELSKKFKWIDKNNIPKQNVIIGIVAGIIVFLTGLSDNIFVSVPFCIMSAWTAGGAYEYKKSGEVEEE